jgi:uncharacterized protein YggE
MSGAGHPEGRGLPRGYAAASSSLYVPALGDIAEPARIIVGRRKTAAEAATSAQEQSADFAKQLIRAGVPVRDVAELLGLSFQRVSQPSAR